MQPSHLPGVKLGSKSSHAKHKEQPYEVDEYHLPHPELKLVKHIGHEHLVVIENKTVQPLECVLQPEVSSSNRTYAKTHTQVRTKECTLSVSCLPL
jgi:hypothetical protein